jgi:hypothetical protein
MTAIFSFNGCLAFYDAEGNYTPCGILESYDSISSVNITVELAPKVE